MSAVVPATEKTELVQYYEPEPREVVARAAKMAEALMQVIEKAHGLAVDIRGRRYLRVEAWMTLAAFVQASVGIEEVAPLPDGQGYVAWAVVTARDGRRLARAQASCSRDEEAWAERPDYAVRSMAETRAAAKALRLAFAHVPVLAGFEATPAEEVEGAEARRVQRAQAKSPSQRPAPAASQPGQKDELRARFAAALKAAGWPLQRAREVWQPLYPGAERWDDLQPYQRELVAEAAPHLLRLVQQHGVEGAAQLVATLPAAPDLVTVEELAQLASSAEILGEAVDRAGAGEAG